MSLVEEYLAHLSKDGKPKDVVELSQQLYRDYLSPIDLEIVDALDPGDAAYFWSRLYYDVQEKMDHAILYGMEDRAKRNIHGLSEQMSATPFKDAESSIKAGSWFGRSQVQRDV